MKSLILYRSSHGNTEKILKEIARDVKGDVDLAPLKGFDASRLAEYDRIAFGGSIHAGQLHKSVKTFATKHSDALTARPLAMFVGCLDKEKHTEYIDTSFPEALTSHADLKTGIGGNVVMEKLPFFMRLIMKKVTPNEEDRHFVNGDGRQALKEFLQGQS